MQIELRKISELKPYSQNSRTHSKDQIKKVAASIKEFGFTSPILIKTDGTILAGHGRVEAATILGMVDVPCIQLAHLTPEQARAYVIADNALAELSGWDDDLLKKELAALQSSDFNLELLGLNNLDEMLTDLAGGHGKADPDGVPPLPDVPIARAGDVWVLGDHRLLCGDSTNATDCARLMGVKRGDMVFTDPPYGVSYAEKNEYLNAISRGNHIQTPIKNDHETVVDMKKL